MTSLPTSARTGRTRIRRLPRTSGRPAIVRVWVRFTHPAGRPAGLPLAYPRPNKQSDHYYCGFKTNGVWTMNICQCCISYVWNGTLFMCCERTNFIPLICGKITQDFVCCWLLKTINFHWLSRRQAKVNLLEITFVGWSFNRQKLAKFCGLAPGRWKLMCLDSRAFFFIGSQ